LIGAGHLTAYYRGLLLQGLVFTGGVIALWSCARLSPTSAVAGSTAGALVALVVHSRAVRAGFAVTANAGDLADRLSSLATHAWLANTATFFSYRLDYALVRLFTGTAGLGIYSTATAIAELGRTAPNALAQAALRHLGAASSEERRGVASYAALLSLVCAVATLLPLVLLSKWLVPLFYGPSFAAVVPVVAWLGPGVVLLAVASVSASWLNVSGRSSTAARLAWVGTAAAGLMALLLIPRWGVVGAAAASSVGYAVLAVLVWRAAARD
jgi:O-antigen/teichoic acid export membrane protein